MAEIKLNRVQFAKAVDAFRTYREEIGRVCFNRNDVLRFLTSKLDFGSLLTPKSIGDILETLGLNLNDVVSVRSPRTQSSDQRFHDIRVLIQEVGRLHRDLGSVPSEAFRELFERKLGRPFKAPTPVSEVPDSTTLSIAR